MIKLRRIAVLVMVCKIVIHDSPQSLAATKTPFRRLNFESAHFSSLKTDPLMRDCGSVPPDTMGTVGHDHVVELLNCLYTVVDRKTGNSQVYASRDEDFWSVSFVDPADASVMSSSFDPRIVYDPYTQRYFAAGVSNSKSPESAFLIAASNSSNPVSFGTGGDDSGWSGFLEDADATDLRWADFPTLGFTDDTVVISAHMVPYNMPASSELTVLSIPKEDLISDEPTLENMTRFEGVRDDLDLLTTRLHPAVNLDHEPAVPSLWATTGGGDNRIRRVDIVGSQLVDRGYVQLPTRPQPPSGGDQPNTTVKLQRNRASLTSNPVIQDGVLWGVQVRGDDSLNTNNDSALRWFKIDTDLNANAPLIQEGVFWIAVNGDQGTDLMYPSIAVNKLGDAVIGFTATGPNTTPRAYSAIGQTDSQGVTTFEGFHLANGSGSWTIYDGRFGDYSATVVDPVNPLHFWTFQEYTKEQDVWATRITQIDLTPDIDGDMNFDTVFDLDDVDFFLSALLNRDNYYAIFMGEPYAHGDFDDDDDTDLDDVDGFVDALTAGSGSNSAMRSSSGQHQVPEPTSLVIFVLGVFIASRRCLGHRGARLSPGRQGGPSA